LKCPLHIIVGNVPVLPSSPAITNSNLDSPPIIEGLAQLDIISESIGNAVNQKPTKLQSSISVDYPELGNNHFFITTFESNFLFITDILHYNSSFEI